LLDRNAIEGLLRMANVINVVEAPLRIRGEGKGKMPAKTDLSPGHGDFRAMPGVPGSAAVKWVNIHRENPYRSVTLMWKVVEANESGS